MYIWDGIEPFAISILIWAILKIILGIMLYRAFEVENPWIKWKWKLNFKNWLNNAVPSASSNQFLKNWLSTILLELLMLIGLNLILGFFQYGTLKILNILNFETKIYYNFADMIIKTSWIKWASLGSFWALYLFNIVWSITRARIKRNLFNR